MTRLVEFLTLVPPCRSSSFSFLFFSSSPFFAKGKGRGRLEDFATEIGGGSDLSLIRFQMRFLFEMEQVLLVSSEIGNGEKDIVGEIEVFLWQR